MPSQQLKWVEDEFGEFCKPSFLFKVSAFRAECKARYRPKAKQLALLDLPGHPPHHHPTCCSDSGPGCRGWDVRLHVRVTACP